MFFVPMTLKSKQQLTHVTLQISQMRKKEKVGIKKKQMSVKRKQKKNDIENEMTYMGP